jgi:hypothetical protein
MPPRNQKKPLLQFLNFINRYFDTWNYISSSDSAGGILMGFNSLLFNPISWTIGNIL